MQWTNLRALPVPVSEDKGCVPVYACQGQAQIATPTPKVHDNSPLTKHLEQAGQVLHLLPLPETPVRVQKWEGTIRIFSSKGIKHLLHFALGNDTISQLSLQLLEIFLLPVCLLPQPLVRDDAGGQFNRQ